MASTPTSTLAGFLPDVHEPGHGAGHAHGRDEVQGYLVVRTDWSAGPTSREPVAYFAVEASFRSGETRYTSAYGDALDCVRAERASAGEQQYAVIDTVYDCGCRFIG